MFRCMTNMFIYVFSTKHIKNDKHEQNIQLHNTDDGGQAK